MGKSVSECSTKKKIQQTGQLEPRETLRGNHVDRVTLLPISLLTDIATDDGRPLLPLLVRAEWEFRVDVVEPITRLGKISKCLNWHDSKGNSHPQRPTNEVPHDCKGAAWLVVEPGLSQA